MGRNDMREWNRRVRYVRRGSKERGDGEVRRG